MKHWKGGAQVSPLLSVTLRSYCLSMLVLESDYYTQKLG
jgi:hypothetical protein